jgi:glycerol-3-phosphate acyltransferase PlsY
MDIKFALLILGAYLLGSVPAAYLAAKWSRGIDIRQYGSGNVGFTNLFRFTPKKVAFSVLVFDLAKGMSIVVAARLLGMSIAQQVTAGVAVVIGHSWPVFLRFNGGKGVLSTLGVALILPSINSLVPWEIIVFLVIAAVCLFGFGSLPVGTGAGMSTMPLVSWGLSRPLALTLGFLVMFLLIVIRRLAAPRTSVTASVSRGQLIFNRLIFDRDIRDREAWVSRVPRNKQNDEHEE